MYTKKIEVRDTGVNSVGHNMELDGLWLSELEDFPILHFYDWDVPSATFGHFILLNEHVHPCEIAFARRPTGGGITFHLWDLAFSFLMPGSRCSNNTLENYQFVNQIVLAAVQELFPVKGVLIPESVPAKGTSASFCMARPTVYDAVCDGLKIAGAAQRRTKRGYLHQGTISLAAPDLELLSRILIDHETLVQAMADHSFAPLGRCTAEVLAAARLELKAQLAEKFTSAV